MFEFLERLGDRSVRVAYEPEDGFLAVPLAGVRHCDLRHERLPRTDALRGQLDRAVSKGRVAQSVSEVIKRAGGDVLIDALVTPPRSRTHVVETRVSGPWFAER